MNKKIKLIFFHPYSYLGGADNSLRRLIENLDLNKFSITFISLNRSYLKNILLNNIEFRQLKSKRTLFAIYEIKKILKNIEKNKNYKKVILISNQNFANVIASFCIEKNSRIKSIFIDRNHLDELSFYKGNIDKIKKIVIKILVKLRYQKANIVVGICKKLSNDLQSYINKKVVTIYSPSYDKKIIKKSKQKINLDKKYKYILNVSRFSKRKDHYTTLKAFEIALRKIKNLKLILIGYGPERKNITNLAKNLKINKNIIIINKAYNPYPYMKRSNLLILTSVYEGFPNVLVESLTIGTPVISTNANAGASEILLNGKGGDLIKIRDYRNLARKILNHFSSPKTLIKKARIAKKNLYRFETKRHSKIYTNLFQKI
tara:strand:+ start:839 stop:1960 length:1122 start_codon:yes stop_codon:yes gene_type:complete